MYETSSRFLRGVILIAGIFTTVCRIRKLFNRDIVIVWTVHVLVLSVVELYIN
jgi:hypothetical protein